MTAPTVFKIRTRGWGETPCIGIRMGRHVRLAVTPDFEEAQLAAGKPCPAWLESDDCEAPEEFFAALEVARKELA